MFKIPDMLWYVRPHISSDDMILCNVGRVISQTVVEQ